MSMTPEERGTVNQAICNRERVDDLESENDELREKVRTICEGLKTIAQITHWDGDQAKKVRGEALRLLTAVPTADKADVLRAKLLQVQQNYADAEGRYEATYSELTKTQNRLCAAREALEEIKEATKDEPLWNVAKARKIACKALAYPAPACPHQRKAEELAAFVAEQYGPDYALPHDCEKILAEHDAALNARIAELEAKLAKAMRALATSEELRETYDKEAAAATVRAEKAEHDANEAQCLFDLQRSRTEKADALWKAAHPDSMSVFPDLGTLIDWLLERAETAEAALSEAKEQTR